MNFEFSSVSIEFECESPTTGVETDTASGGGVIRSATSVDDLQDNLAVDADAEFEGDQQLLVSRLARPPGGGVT